MLLDLFLLLRIAAAKGGGGETGELLVFLDRDTEFEDQEDIHCPGESVLGTDPEALRGFVWAPHWYCNTLQHAATRCNTLRPTITQQRYCVAFV